LFKPNRHDQVLKGRTSKINRPVVVLPPPYSVAYEMFSDLALPIHKLHKLQLVTTMMMKSKTKKKRKKKEKEKKRKRKRKMNRSKMKSVRWNLKRVP
jgi:hypothetical protein